MKNNSIQFAVVREDPQIEMDIAGKFRLNRATLIGSGGCTAFCLKALKPEMEITLIEPNPSQIELIKEKIQLLKSEEKEIIFGRFGVGNPDKNSFIERGNFESLFRQFRFFIREFIASETEIENAFKDNAPQFWTDVFAHPFWKVSFELFFSDSILTAMFTGAAIQHTSKNSYPTYFQTVLEKGLLRKDASRNYFLHHIFTGHYLNDENALPYYLVNMPANLEFEFFNGFAQNYQQFRGKQLVHFSNIFDWCDKTTVAEIINAATSNLEKGSVVVLRQLNNDKNYREIFGSGFRWLPTESIARNDRSLFYSKIEIGEKIL
ncbi:MAG: DUF3419 family protein [Acidobacteriota bacterium]|nr:DUF3419 family protein [Acidobacteriota bacterium]